MCQRDHVPVAEVGGMKIIVCDDVLQGSWTANAQQEAFMNENMAREVERIS